jgi:hypothetical protein
MRAGVGVVPPGAAQAGLLFNDHEVMDACALQPNGHAQARHARTQDHHLVLGGHGRRGGGQRPEDEPGHAVDGGVGAGQGIGVQLKHMPAMCRDLAAHVHAGGLQGLVQRQRLGVQQLVGAGLDQHRRQAVQVGVQGRDQRLGERCCWRIGANIVAGADCGPAPAQHGLTRRRQRGRAGRGQVYPGREQRQGRRGRSAGIAQGQCRGQRQTAPGRIAHQDDRAVGAQGPVGGDCIVQCSRIGMFRRQPVVGGEHRQPGDPRQARGEGPVRGRAAHAIGAAVQVQDAAGSGGCPSTARPFTRDTAHRAPNDADAARPDGDFRQAG